MILVELNGGIGNQMFQYAAAKSLALHHKVELKLDVTPASDKNMPSELSKRPYDLHYFNLPDKIADKSIIDSFTNKSLLTKISEKLKPNFKRKIYREPFFHFDTNFFKSNNNVYLKGLWQSEKYFKPFEESIRSVFKFDSVDLYPLENIATKLKSENSVAVHIRRGDYLAKVSLEVLGLMPVEYYRNAVAIMNSKITSPVFYFFSDDIKWVEEQNLVPAGTYVSKNITKNHFEDLYLMSQCKHNIIANSSFSWWGAWLNANPGKTVIAPEKWFNKKLADTKDLIPAGWSRI